MNNNISSLLKIEDLNDGIFKIILNDPESQNTLSEKMIDELQSTFEEFEKGPSRVLILASSGKVFSAGHDLKEIKAARSTADHGKEYFSLILKKSTLCHDRQLI